jgi:hypothetical protein
MATLQPTCLSRVVSLCEPLCPLWLMLLTGRRDAADANLTTPGP